MGVTTWHRARGGAGALLLACAASVGFALAVPASGATQEEQEGPTVAARAEGGTAHGDRLVITTVATHPAGWRALGQVDASLVLHGVTLETLKHKVDDALLLVGNGKIPLGTANEVSGTFLRVSGLDVEVETAGERLTTTIRAAVTQELPADAELTVTATDDSGQVAEETIALPARAVTAPEEPSGGPSWVALATAAAAALFAGGFVGGRLALHRTPPSRPSVYATVQRRMREEDAPATRGDAGGPSP